MVNTDQLAYPDFSFAKISRQIADAAIGVILAVVADLATIGLAASLGLVVGPVLIVIIIAQHQNCTAGFTV